MSNRRLTVDGVGPAVGEPRSIVITGTSRGLGFATAVHLYNLGWRVVGAMRSPEEGLVRLRAATGALSDDPRMIGVRVDLTEQVSIETGAKAIEEAVGAPDVLVHNAGIAALGCVEELPSGAWQQIFSTHLFGPAALTKALLPAMRAAGKGRIVVVSSEAGIRGMPLIAAYSAAKGALERWAEALANEVAPFGLGVTILVAGTFDTDIITAAGNPFYGDRAGPYGAQYNMLERRGLAAMRFANPPARFARGLAKALEDRDPFTRHAVGLDARMLLIANRLLPGGVLHHVTRLAMGLPPHRQRFQRGRLAVAI